MYKIIKIEKSPRKGKRLRVFLDDGFHYDFGLETGSTYLDHHDVRKRENYIKRHYANAREKEFINNLIPSASLFSMFLLWGPNESLENNIKYLNDLWADKK